MAAGEGSGAWARPALARLASDFWHLVVSTVGNCFRNRVTGLAAEAAFFACDRAIQTHGGMGYAREYHVERYWREARLMKIAPVSQEMVCNYIGANVLGLPKSY